MVKKKIDNTFVMPIIAFFIMGIAGYFLYQYKDNINNDIEKETMGELVSKDPIKLTVFKREFMEKCLDADYRKRSFCDCIYDGMMETWGAERFVNEAYNYAFTEVYPEEILNRVDYCYSEFEYLFKYP